MTGSELRSTAGVSSQTTVDGENGELRLAAGLLIDIVGTSQSLPSARLGISYQPGFDWTANVTGGDGAPAEAALRRPSLVAAGLGWRADNHWSYSVQADFIRFRDVVETLRRNVGDEAAAGFDLPDEVEPRIGGEFATPLTCGCGSIKVRAGLHYRSPGTLRYEGDDPEQAAAFTSQGGWSCSRSAGRSSPSTSATRSASISTRGTCSTVPPFRSAWCGGSEVSPIFRVVPARLRCAAAVVRRPPPTVKSPTDVVGRGCPPERAQDGEVRVVFLGDSGYGTGVSEWGAHGQEAVANQVNNLALKPDLVFFLGDNIYWQGSSDLYKRASTTCTTR